MNTLSRVENSMRGLVRSAAQSASATARKVKKTEAAGHSDEPRTNDSSGSELKAKTISQYSDQQKPSNPSKRTRPEAFQTYSASAPRRLNDIVHAPPTLKTLPRKAKVTQGVSVDHAVGKESTQKRSLREGVLSMAQKAMLEEERERAIRLYREMKKR